MLATPTIRPASAADAFAVALLVRRLLEIVLPPERLTPLATLEQTAARLLAEGAIVAYLAEAGGAPVGLVTLTEFHAIFARGVMGEICEIYVEPTWRSSGLGERLVATARDHGQARGWSRIELTAPMAGSAGAERAWAFYRRLGFADIGPRLMLPL